MSTRAPWLPTLPTVLALSCLAALPVLGGCAGKQKKKPAPPPAVEVPKVVLSRVKASVTSAEHTGAAAAGRPKITLAGEAPEGWTIEVEETVEGKAVTIRAWANPPKDAEEQAANKAYEHVHVVGKLEGGPWKVHVMDDRNVEVKFFEFSY